MRNHFRSACTLCMILFGLYSCETPPETTYEGEIILSSRFDFTDATVMGYHFETSDFTPFPSGGEPVPDILVERYLQVNGSIEPGFNSPSNDHGFALLGDFQSDQEASTFFENYTNIETGLAFSSLTDTVRRYQVYLLKTRTGDFAKLMVEDIEYKSDNAGNFVNVTTAFAYQNDGSGNFR